MNNKSQKRAFLSILAVGVLSLGFTLLTPSEAGTAFLFGYSKDRLALIGLQILLLFLSIILYAWLSTKGRESKFIQGFLRSISSEANADTVRTLLLCFAVYLGIAFCCELIFLPQVLAPITGWLAYTAWMLVLLHSRFSAPARRSTNDIRESLLPSLKNLTTAQKRTALILLAAGLVYFLLLVPASLQNSATMTDFSLDEMVQYPVVMKMLTAQESVRMTLYKFLAYGEYIYGFPFYGTSALLLIPMKLAAGLDLAGQTQINIFILRMFVSTLPVILSIYILTYLATSFRKWWLSLGLFILMLTLPGVAIYNSGFWHPDGINFLFISIGLYYLSRDRLRFGRNFFMAAAAIGLSVATRLFGLFFFLAIAGLLAAGLVRKILTLRQALVKGALFILLMAAVIMVANPFLFNPGEYRAVVSIYQKQQVQVSQGVDEPDPEGVYRTGIEPWLPVMKTNYGSGLTLGFLALSAIAGLAGGRNKRFNRILFAWVVVILSFMVYFVKMKSYWYLMPAMVPLYCYFTALPDLASDWPEKASVNQKLKMGITVVVWLAAVSIGLYQLYLNIRPIVNQFIS